MKKETIKKEIWVDCRKKDLEELARNHGATGILGKSNFHLNCITNPYIYRIKSNKDIQKLPSDEDHLFVEFLDWNVIPTENLITKYADSKTRIIVKTNNMREMKTLAITLERGVDGFLVDESERIKDFCSLFKSTLKLDLVNAIVTEVERVDGLGKRICIDGVITYNPREGLLVGALTDFMFLANGETAKNPYIKPREWRVNAGGAPLYTLCRSEVIITPRYLDDLASGDEVVVVDSNGNTRIQKVLRSKKEWRPMIYIKAECEGRIGSTCSQNAETVSLVTSKGAKPVTEIKVGDKIKAYISKKIATHFGRPVGERIDEV